jgi:hypothetical protein
MEGNAVNLIEALQKANCSQPPQRTASEEEVP